MPDNNTIINALLNTFPSIASFYDFKENDREISRRAIPGIIKYAFSHSIIETNSEESFTAFLEKTGKTDCGHKPPAGLTFSGVMDKLSGNLSVNALIAQLDVTARELSLPEIQAPMITRLKKKFVINTPKKRALLRILAFKLAQKYPDLNWHYELLLQLPVSPENRIDAVHETAGATITFHLQSQGEVIVPPDVAWLKNELSDCIEYLRLENHFHKKIIETIGATSFNIKSPKKPGPQDEPRLYNEAIRNVLAIAHQMSARWLLSEYSSPQKKLIIIVYAGIMTDANLSIQRILEINLTAESGIYLTDFAHLCALYASVKAGFELYAKHFHPATGYSGDLWSVTYFLSYSYYDYIPCLLTEKMLPRSVSESAYEDFKRVLHFPEQAGHSSFGAITAMHRFPQSALLLTEIAKVLRARRMPYEADAVITNLLLSNPLNLVARLMRMLMYSNIAQTQADLASAKLAFERAETEGDFIVSYCATESEIWHEVGVHHFGRAMKYLKYLHDKNPANRSDVKKQDILHYLEKARKAFLQSMTVSATGKALNSLYMFAYTLCLIELFSPEDKPAGKARQTAMPDYRTVFKIVSTRIFRNIGWLRDEAPTTDNKLEKTFQNLLLTLNLVIARYENLVLCRSNIPFMKYMFALILWDFAPVITPQICRLTLEWLRIARKETEKLVLDNISVYHVATGNIAADKFLLHIQDTVDVICKHVTDEDLKQEKDCPLLKTKFKELSNIKLMLLELDRSHTEPIILCA
jgi:hypothetical protein